MERIGNTDTRIGVNFSCRQFVIIPTFGFTRTQFGRYRYAIAFIWLNIQARCSFLRRY